MRQKYFAHCHFAFLPSWFPILWTLVFVFGLVPTVRFLMPFLTAIIAITIEFCLPGIAFLLFRAI